MIIGLQVSGPPEAHSKLALWFEVHLFFTCLTIVSHSINSAK